MSPVRASDGWRRKKGSVRHKAKSRVYILKDDPKWDVAEIVERGVYERLSVGNGSVVPENLSSERSRALTEHASCTPENTLYGKISVSSNPASEGIFSAGSGGPENLQVEVVENFTRVSPPLSVPNLRSHHGSHNSKVLVKQASFNPSRRSKAAWRPPVVKLHPISSIFPVIKRSVSSPSVANRDRLILCQCSWLEWSLRRTHDSSALDTGCALVACLPLAWL